MTATALKHPALPFSTRPWMRQGWGLLCREWWEHRKVVERLPVWVAVALLALNALAVLGFAALSDTALVGEALAHGALLRTALAMPFWVMSAVTGLSMAVYALSTLHDERRERSGLFWQSLPVSDAQVVASKALMALLVGPAWAGLIAAATSTLVGLMWTVGLAAVGQAAAAWAQVPVIPVLSHGLVALPLHALWALPSVGWLLWCSARAKRVPVLSALLIPWGVSIAAQMGQALWPQVIAVEPVDAALGRVLLGLFPGHSWAHADAASGLSLMVGAGLGLILLALAARARRTTLR